MNTTREALINGFQMEAKAGCIKIVYMSFGIVIKVKIYEANVECKEAIEEKLMKDTTHNLNLCLYPETNAILLREMDEHVNEVLLS